jgi:thiol:disulfide interchange protein
MKSVVNGLEQRFKGSVEFRIYNVDKKQAEVGQLANAFGVQYVPTFVFINRDGSRSDLIVGEVTSDTLSTKLAALK